MEDRGRDRGDAATGRGQQPQRPDAQGFGRGTPCVPLRGTPQGRGALHTAHCPPLPPHTTPQSAPAPQSYAKTQEADLRHVRRGSWSRPTQGPPHGILITGQQLRARFGRPAPGHGAAGARLGLSEPLGGQGSEVALDRGRFTQQGKRRGRWQEHGGRISTPFPCAGNQLHRKRVTLRTGRPWGVCG